MQGKWSKSLAFVFLAWACGPGPAAAAEGDKWTAARANMVRTIERHGRYVGSALQGRSLDARVLKVVGAVPRHLFIPRGLRHRAYADRPLPIGFGQTISQPFIVALMTHLAAVGRGDVVLEVGTGSGYQAAVLAPLVRQVCTIEIIPGLAKNAARLFKRLAVSNVKAKLGDGYYGWEACGPFDAILVTAAATHVPPPLVRQLKAGGRMIIPVGAPFATQQLVVVTKDENGRARTRQMLPVVFVPLTGRHK
jgi:protein-L-isoaspartate(D-aspartate) O-methyltransferase